MIIAFPDVNEEDAKLIYAFAEANGLWYTEEDE